MRHCLFSTATVVWEVSTASAPDFHHLDPWRLVPGAMTVAGGAAASIPAVAAGVAAVVVEAVQGPVVWWRARA
jgi:hypothetical protein